MNSEELLLAAKAKMEAGEYREAIELATQSKEAGQTQIAVSQILAHSHYNLHEHSEALHWYIEALKIEPTNKQAMLQRSICYALCGQMDESVASGEEYLKLYPDKEGYYHRGYVLLAMNKFQEAREAIYKAIELNCTNPLIWFYAGVLHYNLKENLLAKQYLLKAAELMPEHSETAFLLGNIYFTEKDMHACVTAMSKVLYYDETHQQALYYRAVAKKDTGDFAGAEKDANKLLALNENFFQVEKDGKRLKIVAIKVTEKGDFNFSVE